MTEWLALPTLDHKVEGLNPAGDGIQLMTIELIVHSLSLSFFLHLDMT